MDVVNESRNRNELFSTARYGGGEFFENGEKYRCIFEGAANPIILYDPVTFRTVDFNSGAHESLGYTREEFGALGIEDYEVDINEKKIQARIRDHFSKERISFETRYKRKDGDIRDVLVNSKCIDIGGAGYILSILTDITGQKKSEAERIRQEKQLRQAQKIESIGTLAGGIAHDFNNILAIIQGYAELSMLDISDEMERTRGNMSQLISAVSRAQKLVARILAFSRRGDEKFAPIVVNAIIKECLEMIRPTIPSAIEIKQHIENEPFLIMGDANQVHRIMMNLCSNAVHAIGEQPGVIAVEVKPFEWDGDDLGIDIKENIKSGSYVQLIVSDTGHGMTPDVLERIFDPYFTTKEPGQGTGLGMAVVQGIVKSYNGYIAVNSKPGAGTLVYVLIPLLDPEKHLDITK